MGRQIPQPPRRLIVSVMPSPIAPERAYASIVFVGFFLMWVFLVMWLSGCASKPSSQKVADVPLPVQQDVELLIDWSIETEQAIEVPGGKIVHVNMSGATEGGHYVLALATGHLSKKLEHVPDSAVAVISWPEDVSWLENLAPHVATPEPWIVGCVYFRKAFYCTWQGVERF